MARKTERDQPASKSKQAVEGRIQIGGEAIGAPGEGALAERALELAEIEGRPGRPNAQDLEQARRELGASPRSEAASEEPVEGPEARDPEGALAGEVGPTEPPAVEDESRNAENLAREGVREAEHERMLESRRNEEEL